MRPLVSCDYKWERKNMQRNIKSAILTLALALLLPTSSFARLENLPVASDGGLQVGSTKAPYWFNLSGVSKFDSRSFMGDTKTTPSGLGNLGTYMSAVFIRDLGLVFEGGIGQDFGYTIEFNFDVDDNATRIDSAYITYYGFRCVLPNLSVSLGQVLPGFCLNCAMSSKWSPFMERSMATNTFGPQAGLGINANTYNDHYSATVAVTQQPKSGGTIRNVYGQPIRTHDLWQASTRLTWAPWSAPGRIFQVGLSAHIQEYASNGLQFRAMPEMRSRNSTPLLNTTTFYTSSTNPGSLGGAPNQLWIAATNQKTLDWELLAVYGPLSFGAEYQRAFIARGEVNNVSQGGNLQFWGYDAMVGYILTGEVRSLKKPNGTLAQIKPIHKYGAVEIAARYSFLTLNNKGITGGLAHNTTAAASWYINDNIKLMAEYVVSLQRRQFPTYLDDRVVSGIGLRAQFVF